MGGVGDAHPSVGAGTLEERSRLPSPPIPPLPPASRAPRSSRVGGSGYGEPPVLLTEWPGRPEQGSERWEQPPGSAGEEREGVGEKN